MAIEYLSSEEMVRRAKDAMRLAKEDFLPKVDKDLADMGLAIGGVNFSMPDEMPERMPDEMPTPAMSDRVRASQVTAEPTRDRRVASTTPDHLVVAPRPAPSYSIPVPAWPANTGALGSSGKGLRVVGSLLLGFVAVVWVLLLVGLIDSPQDAGDVVGGGVALTLVPLLFGLVLRRAGKRRGTAV